jgi:Rieske Fe-S protein
MTFQANAEIPGPDCEECKPHESHEISRRSFFASLIGMGSAFIAGIVGTPLFRFVLYPVYASSGSQQWSEVGSTSEFETTGQPVVKTVAITNRDGWRDVVSNHPVFVNRTAEGKFQVLSSVCPHLGCSVAWHPERERFVCPCHGGQFAADGKRISGPPPRGLDALEAQVKDGKLQVRFELFRSNVPDQQRLS